MKYREREKERKQREGRRREMQRVGESSELLEAISDGKTSLGTGNTCGRP